MATGQLPFRGETSGVVFNSILERDPIPAVRLNPDLPPKLEDVINRALEKDRELRYQVAKEMRAELLRLKRDTETGRRATPSSGPVTVAQESSSSRGVASQPVPTSGSAPAVAASSSSVTVKVAESPAAGLSRFWKVLVPVAVVLVAALFVGGILYYRSRSSSN